MKEDKHPKTPDEFEADVERALEEKHDAVIAADATGMLSNEEFTRTIELREGEVTPPA